MECVATDNESKPVVVYGLRSSENGKIRYVGQTTQSLKKRIDAHFTPNKEGRKRRVWKWINGVLSRGFKIEAVVLQENAVWNESEIKWIAWFIDGGSSLVNSTSGGEGTFGRKWTQEQKDHMSMKMSGKKKSPEHIAKLVASHLGKKPTDAARENQSLAKRGRSPSNLLAMQKGNIGLVRTEEHKAKISKAMKGRMVTSREQLLKNLGRA